MLIAGRRLSGCESQRWLSITCGQLPGPSSVTNLATNLPDLATKRGTLATGLGIWNLATFLATFRIKVKLLLATKESRLHNTKNVLFRG